MILNIYKNGTSLTAFIKSLGLKFYTAFVVQQAQSVYALFFFAVTIFPIVQPNAEQNALHIGGKSMTPEVTVNLNAIYGRSEANFKQNLPSKRPRLVPNFGNRQLLVPNLRTANKLGAIILHPPNTVRPMDSQVTGSTLQRTAWQKPLTENADVMSIVTPLSLPTEKRDVLVTGLPSLPKNPVKEEVSEAKPAIMLKKQIRKKKVAIVGKEPNLIGGDKVLKTSPVQKMKRLTPPPPPPPSVNNKAELRKFSKPATTKLMAKKPENDSDKTVIKSKIRLDRLASLPASSDRMLEVRFRSGSSVLTLKDEMLLKNLAKKLGSNAIRLQLKGFAEATGNNSSKARRLSLSRALAVRAFLIENGLRSTRIDVRALGIARDGGAPDRVEIFSLD